MSYAFTIKDIIMDEVEQERVESLKHQAQLAKKPRANEQQVGGDHYKNMGVEPWDVIDTWPLYQRVGYYRGNALKYLMRMGAKDEAPQEVQKGIHYLEKLLEVLKND